MTIRNDNARTPQRRGAALIIALVLLLLVAAISTSLLRGFYADLRNRNRSLIRNQAETLRLDFAERAKLQRAATPDFPGETITLAELSPKFDGTFQLASNFAQTSRDDASDAADAEPVVVIEYRDAAGKLIYVGRPEIQVGRVYP